MTRKSASGLRTAFYFFGILLLLVHRPLLGAKDQKMKPEELIAKHLDSIGTPEARVAAKNRVAVGAGQILFRLPSTGNLNGKAELISDGKMMRISMIFDLADYPSEQFAFDGSKINTSQIRPGVRVNMAAFAYQYDTLLKEGLIGGTMTTAWCLFDVAGRQPKLEYTGLKKVDGKQLHELKYRAKKGAADLIITLHFDPETYRHVHTEYRLVQPANMAGTPAESSTQRDTLYHIEERFSDFRTVDSLTLPYAWKLTYSREGMGTTLLSEYNIVLAQIAHNQTLDAKAFGIK